MIIARSVIVNGTVAVAALFQLVAQQTRAMDWRVTLRPVIRPALRIRAIRASQPCPKSTAASALPVCCPDLRVRREASIDDAQHMAKAASCLHLTKWPARSIDLCQPQVEMRALPFAAFSPRRPPLEGNCLVPFTQYHSMGRAFDLLALCPDRSNAAAGGDHSGLVEAVAEHLSELHTAAPQRPLLLMGESFGGVQALAVAMHLKEMGRSSVLAGIITVNPATSYFRTDLPEKAAMMPKMSEWRFQFESLLLFATRVIDPVQARTIVDSLLDSPLNDPARCPPPLAAHFKALLPAFTEGFQAPRPYFEARLISLGPAVRTVNSQLEREREAALGGVPMLLIAGTADKLVLSASEAKRLKALLGGVCTVYEVEGAGHAGTLDERIDLLRVVEAWQAASSKRKPSAMGSTASDGDDASRRLRR